MIRYNSLHTTVCSAVQDSKLWITKIIIQTSSLRYNPLYLRSSTHNMCVKNFLLLQAVGFYDVVYHSNNTFDNNFECVKVHYGCPDGNTSLITLQAVDKRWVHNIHCLFTLISSCKSTLRVRRNCCSRNCEGDNCCGVISGVVCI